MMDAFEDEIDRVEVQLRTFSWLISRLGDADMCDDYAFGLYLIGESIADGLKAIRGKIREEKIREVTDAAVGHGDGQ